LDKIFRDN